MSCLKNFEWEYLYEKSKNKFDYNSLKYVEDQLAPLLLDTVSLKDTIRVKKVKCDSGSCMMCDGLIPPKYEMSPFLIKIVKDKTEIDKVKELNPLKEKTPNIQYCFGVANCGGSCDPWCVDKSSYTIFYQHLANIEFKRLLSKDGDYRLLALSLILQIYFTLEIVKDVWVPKKIDMNTLTFESVSDKNIDIKYGDNYLYTRAIVVLPYSEGGGDKDIVFKTFFQEVNDTFEKAGKPLFKQIPTENIPEKIDELGVIISRDVFSKMKGIASGASQHLYGKQVVYGPLKYKEISSPKAKPPQTLGELVVSSNCDQAYKNKLYSKDLEFSDKIYKDYSRPLTIGNNTKPSEVESFLSKAGTLVDSHNRLLYLKEKGVLEIDILLAASTSRVNALKQELNRVNIVIQNSNDPISLRNKSNIRELLSVIS